MPLWVHGLVLGLEQLLVSQASSWAEELDTEQRGPGTSWEPLGSSASVTRRDHKEPSWSDGHASLPASKSHTNLFGQL